MSTTIQAVVIRNAINLIRDKQRWTKNTAMRTANGQRTSRITDATRYCAFAALMVAAESLSVDKRESTTLALSAEKAIVSANDWPHGARLSRFNDTHSHSLVLNAMSRALS